MKIKNLRCQVKVIRASKKALHRPESASKPAKTFELPLIQSPMLVPVEQETVSETGVGEAVKPLATPDPRAVADRVYDLMREETRLGRLRSGHN